MSQTVIAVQQLSKAYELGKIGTGTISRDIERMVRTRVFGQEDPFLKIGERNDRSVKGDSPIVWSLRDLDFNIQQGEAVGIIGKNGAGKSTLLKLLSRVTAPTTGSIKIKGRISSLLEVGTGFHPELSGRENIFLNGAILGMRKREIAKKLDEIIAFSGVERYVDTPVKRYSSGMYVRLAFAVAAHLESEILIFDEVLAVGDAEFQNKCLGKMGDISKGEGRTVLFVSHNMAAVQNLCNRGIVLDRGQISYQGAIDGAIQTYLSQNAYSENIAEITDRKGNGRIRVIGAQVYKEQPGIQAQTGGPCTIEFQLHNPERIPLSEVQFDIRIDDQMGQRLLWLSNSLIVGLSVGDEQKIRFQLPALPLNQGMYHVTIHAAQANEVFDWVQNAFRFEVSDGDYYGTGKKVPPQQSKVLIPFTVNYV